MNGSLSVKILTLDDFIFKDTHPSPHLIKIDVEGAELKVLEGARRTLMESRPILLLATHGTEVHDACCRLLASVNYRIFSLDGSSPDNSNELIARPCCS